MLEPMINEITSLFIIPNPSQVSLLFHDAIYLTA